MGKTTSKEESNAEIDQIDNMDYLASYHISIES